MVAPLAPFVLPPAPPDRARAGRIAIYGIAGAVTLGCAMVVGPVGAAFGLPFGGLAYLLTVTRRKEVGAALAMAALDRAARGRFAEARALLDAVAKNVLSSYVGMMVDSQRAALALYEGDLESAIAEATRGAREGKRLDALGRIHQGSALSIRAVALAGLGRKEAALADIAAVRTAKYRQGAFVARAALAEAMIHAREKDLDSLARVLREERPLLFGSTSPRERMVARALSRLVAAKRVSVYREPAKREEQELDENASWVARLAPEAAAYARAPKLGAQLEAPAPVDPELVAGAEKNAPKARSPFKRVAALWLILIGLFLTLWQFLPPSEPTYREAATTATEASWSGSPLSMVSLVLLATIAFLGGLIALRVGRGKRLLVDLSQSMELRQRGRYEEANAAFARLAKSKVPLVAPQAKRELASIAIALGAFDKARQHAEAGIAATRSSPTSLTLSRPVLLPQLHGVLAFALAASGRAGRAEQELEELPKLFPAYPYLARDTFSARLAGLAATGKYEAAAAMARERPADLPLSMQEELLCDALRLRAGDVLPEGERERIELDLQDDTGAARCLTQLAPALLGRTRVGSRLEGLAASTNDAAARAEGDDESASDAAADPAPLAMRRE